MKHITTLILALGGLAALTMTSCNALAGAGRDMQQGGAAIEQAAENSSYADHSDHSNHTGHAGHSH